MLGDMRLGKIVILLLFTLISGVLSKEVSLNEEASERRFSARQVFDYNQPILFESDFGGQGFNKWKLSEDDRYGLAQANPRSLEDSGCAGNGRRDSGRPILRSPGT